MKKLFKNQLFIVTVSVIILVFFERSVPVITLTDRAIVVSVGIDREDGEYVLSAQIARPSRSGDENGGTAFVVVKGKGKSLSAAIEAVGQNCSLDAGLAHCNLIVLGGYIKENGEYPNFENLASSYGLPYEARLVMTDGSAEKVIRYLSLYEISGIRFVNYLKSDRIAAEQFSSSVKQLLYDGTLTGAATRLLNVAFDGDDVSYADEPKESWLEGLKMEDSYAIRYGSRAVYFNEGQTRILNIVLEKPKVGNYVVEVMGTEVDLLLESAESKLSYTISNGQPTVSIKTKLKLKADEFDNKHRDLLLTEEDFFERLEKAVVSAVEQRYLENLYETIEYAVSNGVDLFEVYEGMDRYEHKKWASISGDKKEDYLKLVAFDCKVDITIVGVE